MTADDAVVRPLALYQAAHDLHSYFHFLTEAEAELCQTTLLLTPAQQERAVSVRVLAEHYRLHPTPLHSAHLRGLQGIDRVIRRKAQFYVQTVAELLTDLAAGAGPEIFEEMMSLGFEEFFESWRTSMAKEEAWS